MEELRAFVSENSHTFINHCKVVAKKATILDCSDLFLGKPSNKHRFK